MTIPRIRTVNACPPIKVRHFDWLANYEGDEPNEHGRMAYGTGETEAEAIADLLETYPREIAQ